MKSFLVPLYWLWCGASVFVLVRRRVNRRSGSDPATPSETSADVASAFAVDRAPAPPSVPATAAVLEPAAAVQPSSTPAPPATTLPPPSPDVRALSLGVPLSTVDSLAEALAGISLPCGLAPLMGTGEFDPKTLVLVADDHPAEVVGTAMADEIESLGFTLTPLDEQRLMAQAETATVEVTVFPDVDTVDDAGRRRFPTAPPDSVVVEMRLR